MSSTRKDYVATALVVVAVALYGCFVMFDGFLFIQEVPAMAGIGLLLGFASRRIGGRQDFAHGRAAFAAGLGSMALGIATLVTESEIVLAVFMASMVALWIAAMYARTGRHVGQVRMSH